MEYVIKYKVILCNDLFTLLDTDTDSDPDPGTDDINSKKWVQ